MAIIRNGRTEKKINKQKANKQRSERIIMPAEKDNGANGLEKRRKIKWIVSDFSYTV